MASIQQKKIAELAEVELSEFVKALPISSDFIQKLGEIPERFPDNTMLFVLIIRSYIPLFPRRKD